MPHKKVFSLFGVTKTENVVEFQRQFETLLMSILQKYPYPPGDLLKFLDYPYCVSPLCVIGGGGIRLLLMGASLTVTDSFVLLF